MSNYPPPPLSESDENTWAAIAHLSVLVNLFTGGLGVLGAILVYIAYKDRSRYVAYQALQSFVFQLILWAGGWTIIGIIRTVSGLLSSIVPDIFLFPLMTIPYLMPVVAVVYGIIAGIKCYQGEDFQYWLVGGWMRDTYEG